MTEESNNSKTESSELKQDKGKPTLWDEYKLHIDLYKFYMDMALKANLFFYAIAGTILTVIYNPSRLQDGGVPATLPSPAALRVFLGIPFLMSVLLALTFLSGAILWGILASRINKRVGKNLDVSLEVPPKIHLLTVLLAVLGVIFIVVALYLHAIMRENNVSLFG